MKIEKVVELKPYRGGLKITAGNEKSPKPLENKGFWTLTYATQFDTMQR